uniref:Laminin EGF-like domain-containing protein n=1 Tax=Mesocestoides corti TaxID=53468 RepID=A0A5K3FYY2_MESCO
MVRSQTTEVGCTIEKCQNDGNLSTTCICKPDDFNPRDKPYEEGENCTQCPAGFDCYRKQCRNTLTTLPTTSSTTITSTLPTTSSAKITWTLQILPALMLILRSAV